MGRRESAGQRRADTQSRETAVALSDSMSSARGQYTEQLAVMLRRWLLCRVGSNQSPGLRRQEWRPSSLYNIPIYHVLLELQSIFSHCGLSQGRSVHVDEAPT